MRVSPLADNKQEPIDVSLFKSIGDREERKTKAADKHEDRSS